MSVDPEDLRLDARANELLRYPWVRQSLNGAADEIERLRAEIEQLQTMLVRAENHIPTADLDTYLEAKRRAAAAPTEETPTS